VEWKKSIIVPIYEKDDITDCSNLIVFSHIRLGFTSGVSPQVFSPKPFIAPLLSPIRATFPTNLVFLDFVTE
jgi:hypothetical protein